MTPPRRQLVHAPAARTRLDAARSWLAELSPTQRTLVLAPHPEAAYQLLLSHLQTAPTGALFGPHRMTPWQLATELALAGIMARGLKPVGALGRDALAARVVYRLSQRGQLGRFAAVANRPGVPRALVKTFLALREAELTPAQVAPVDADLAVAFREYVDALQDNGLVDQTDVMRAAAEVATQAAPGSSALLGVPTLGLDLGVNTPLMTRFLAAVGQASRDVLFTVPSHDVETLDALSAGLDLAATSLVSAPAEVMIRNAKTSLEAIQHGLFHEFEQPTRPLDDSVRIVSAPGEGRECLEIARAIRRHAADGVPFDQIAVALRTPGRYRVPLVEALRRAAIPAWLGREARGPDPSGRALLALLACADEGLSSRRFAEYLALGEVPHRAYENAPTGEDTADPAATWVPPIDGEFLPAAVTRGDGETEDEAFAAPPLETGDDAGDDSIIDGQLRAPRQWEHMLEQAAVIGGVDRWHARLDGLANEQRRRLAGLTDPDDPARLHIHRDIRRLDRLRAFALPLIDALEALPKSAHWQTWLTALEALARQALRAPRPVHALLQELHPMAPVGPVTLAEVRLVLEPRLRELTPERGGRAGGQVAICTIDELRGRSFAHVFIPGLQEKVFPRQIAEDPLLLDVTREKLQATHGVALPTQVTRATRERVALAIAVGAASTGIVASYARLDAEKARPRVPSFYGLELLRAAEGVLPDYKMLAARAEGGRPVRLGWPAPDHPEVALDEGEYDLAVLRRLLAHDGGASDGDGDRRGLAHYLLETSPHLARSLRFRARREWPRWTSADGLIVDAMDDVARAALARHQLTARSFSATALQRFSECPYQFLLNTVHKLAPVEERVPLERLDPLHRGSLFHDVQYEVMVALGEADLLPLSTARLGEAMTVLETVLDTVAARYEAELAPAIDRVWQDEMTQLRADLRGSLRRVAMDPDWQPERFELSFGLADRAQADPASQVAPVALDTGLQLRGSIDLVERDARGHRRATDYKTGRPKGDSQTVIAGGAILQPVLYALALEKLMPDAKVEGGRLYYCTERAGYVERVIPLDDVAREAAEKVTLAVDEALKTGYFPAHPRPLRYRGHACRWCDYQVVCGPHVPAFVKKKKADQRNVQLLLLRDEP